jgi:hypothetical protein
VWFVQTLLSFSLRLAALRKSAADFWSWLGHAAALRGDEPLFFFARYGFSYNQ